MRRVLAAVLVLLLLSGSLEMESKKIVVVSNSIDYSSSLITYLGQSFEVISITAQQLPSYQNYQHYVILGGPDAPEGVGEVVRTLLDPTEQEFIRTPGASNLFIREIRGKTFFIFAGATRELTKEVITSNKRRIFEYIPRGPVLWLKDLDIQRVTAMDITDLDRDTRYDYVFGCLRVVSDPWDRGAIYVYENNDLMWYYHVSREIKALTCFDLDHNGKEEIIVACDVLLGNEGDLYVFDHKGILKWRTHVPGSPRGLYCYDHYVAVNLYGGGNRVLIFDNEGTRVADLPVNGRISKFIISDINKDRKKELVVSGIVDENWEHFLTVYDMRGNVLWNYTTFEHINDFQFHDVDNDGMEEALFISYDTLYVTRGGELLGKVHLPPALLHMEVMGDQILLVNSATMFVIEVQAVASLEGESIPLSDFSQMVTSSISLSSQPEFFIVEDIDLDHVDEIVVGNGQALEIYVLEDFGPGISGFVTAAERIIQGVAEEREELPDADFIVYEDSKLGFRTKYYNQWTEEQVEGANAVVFYSPLESEQDVLRENVLVSVYKLQPGDPTDIHEYVERELEEMREQSPDLRVIESTATTMGDSPARRVVYIEGEEIGGELIITVQVGAIKESNLYLMTYISVISTYNRYLPIFEKMVSSFEIIEQVRPVVICQVQFDPEGDDNADLNKEWVKVCNNSDTDVDLSGWTLENDVGGLFEFPQGFVIKAGSFVFVYTGSGTNSDVALYWGSPVERWNNSGDTAVLRDAEGNVMDEYEWTPQ
ncbi:MAG: lamin tail domain-containing protein [Theionarchaea archaeon]|nr:lamin tail domain-containing protein [Theionarchaea archaeon]